MFFFTCLFPKAYKLCTTGIFSRLNLIFCYSPRLAHQSSLTKRRSLSKNVMQPRAKQTDLG